MLITVHLQISMLVAVLVSFQFSFNRLVYFSTLVNSKLSGIAKIIRYYVTDIHAAPSQVLSQDNAYTRL